MSVKCPKCGSEDVSAMKKGFSGGKAVAGAVLTGGIGLLAGMHGSGDIRVACLNCGNKWDPAKLRSNTAQQERMQEVARHTRWKKRFYDLYDSKHFEEASDYYNAKFPFGNSVPDVHAGYKFQKKNDRQLRLVSNILITAFIVLFVLLIWWIS